MEYDPKKQHQRGTKTFKDLSPKERALSISATIINLERAICFRARSAATDTQRRASFEKNIKQIERLVSRLRKHR